jgi:probable F420-dependent oxidoreductase
MNVGRLGVWALVDSLTAEAEANFAQQVEEWGYSALWMGEATGRDVLVNASWLLAKTRSLIVASGIANVYARDAMAMAAARAQLNEQSGGRFLLGIGISHAPLVAAMRGHDYGKPVPTMRAYLEAMARAKYASPAPAQRPVTVLAALGPQMLALAGAAADGGHACNTTVDQTVQAREILGPGKLLCVEQKLLLEPDAGRARAIARANLLPYLGLPNYVNSWRRAGFGDADFAGNLSDRLVDALVAWGDEDALAARIEAHWSAGADHVCIHTMHADPDKSVLSGPNVALLHRLRPLARRSSERHDA